MPLFQDYRESLVSKAGHLIAKYSYGVYLSNLPIIWFAFVKLAFLPFFRRRAMVIPLKVGLPVALYRSIEGPLISWGRTPTERLSGKTEKLSGGVAEKTASAV
jgi:peptidoglycan/LPS O-acetylase OafA/YrhL